MFIFRDSDRGSILVIVAVSIAFLTGFFLFTHEPHAMAELVVTGMACFISYSLGYDRGYKSGYDYVINLWEEQWDDDQDE
jgi:hypothetical protein